MTNPPKKDKLIIKEVDRYEATKIFSSTAFVAKDWSLGRNSKPVKIEGGLSEARKLVEEPPESSRLLVYGYKKEDEEAGRLVTTYLLTRRNLQVMDELIRTGELK